MKLLSINIFFVLLLSITLNISLIGQNLTSRDGEILSETNQYVKRVNVDEGKVLNKNL